MFASIAVTVCLVIYFKYRARRDMQATLRTAIKQGQELTPEIVERLGMPRKGRDQDLRYAIMWLAVAGALALVALAVPDPSGHAQSGTLAGAAFPLCIGIAYVIMWRFTDRAQ